MHGNNRRGAQVLSSYIDAIGWNTVLERISMWAAARDSRYVCICNVHSVVTAAKDKAFQRVLNEADMATPDGMPIAWTLRCLGFAGQERINGPDLMLKYCERAACTGEAVYFYGSTAATLSCLVATLRMAFPGLRIAGAHSPPFRTLSAEEDRTVIDAINCSGARVVFVGLGCPKQEQWMAEHRGRTRAVMIGVGAAFDYHAGTIKRAPLWMQRTGLEWLYRVCSEPRRLSKRYMVTNTLFIVGIMRQLLFGGRKPGR